MCKNLVLKETVWHFRLNVPADLRASFGKTVIMKSLKTGDKRTASKLAKSLSLQWKAKFEEVRASQSAALDPAALEHELAGQLDQLQSQDKLKRAQPPSLVQAVKFILLDQFNQRDKDAERLKLERTSFLNKLQTCLKTNNFNLIQEDIAAFMREHGYHYKPRTIEYNQIARGVVENIVRLATLTQRRDAGDVIGGDLVRTIATPTPRPTIDLDVNSVKPYPLSEIIADYIKKRQDQWAVRSVPKFTAELHDFLEITGDIPMSQIGHATIRDFRETLLRLPSHRNKKKAYRNKTISQLLEMEIPESDLLTPKTVDDKVKTVSGFLKWAVEDGYIEYNYAQSKGIKGAKTASATYQPYSDADLQNIFADKRYVKDQFNKDWQFWMPLLALFTGARQSALAALRCDDLHKTENGVWYIHIEKDKTKSGRRDVPLHKFLVSGLNFPAFVASKKAQGHERIFQTRFLNNNYGHEVSKWYNGSFMPKIAIEEPEEGRRKTFHSFRGTLINAAKQNGSDVSMIEETVGHADSTGRRVKSMSADYYANPHEIEARFKNVIEPIRFVVEDMQHLRRSKFMVKQG
ncbi:MAG: DUF6538 domain-containing protein [Pseudodesulfovibrio sp.]|uniref:DUF6538 domain-containing protein n=1 Tax=Pseudodesulfovibrio sp. TaxID=2035812 RepID=UPI003D14EAAF